MRAYINDIVKIAVLDAVNDKGSDASRIPDKSRMQIKVNIPEVNPAFDTYRIGTLLEMVRHAALALAVEEGKRVRICVQQVCDNALSYY